MSNFTEFIQTAVKDLQKLHSIYGVTVGLVVVSFLAAENPFGAQVSILGVDVPEEKYTLIIGILFGSFVIGAFLKVRQLKSLLLLNNTLVDADTSLSVLRHYPWIFSPFQEGGFYKAGFVSSILIVFIYIAAAAILHIIDLDQEGSIHQLSGLMDLVILAAIIPLIWSIYKYIRDINSDLDTAARNLKARNAEPVVSPDGSATR